MKQTAQHIDKLVDEAIACAKAVKQEGGKSAESSYRVIMALLLRNVLLGVQTLRSYAALITGILGGLLMSKLLGLLFGS